MKQEKEKRQTLQGIALWPAQELMMVTYATSGLANTFFFRVN